MSTIFSLPSELKHAIAKLCSPSTLASLARTHTAYQIEAEQALYHTLYIVTPHDDRCLKTLASNSKKAAYVHVVQIDDRKQRSNYLWKALMNMHSLHDLRLKSNLYQNKIVVGAWIEALNNILCECHFQLQTLYCSDALDICRIFKSQSELKIFGIYNYPHSGFLQTLHNAQSFLPMVISCARTNDYQSCFGIFDHIAVFPTFYSADRNATNHQILVDFLNKDLTCAEMNQVSRFSLYLNPSNMPTIRALAKDLAVIFPQIVRLYLNFEYRCEIAPQEMKEFLSSFSNLRRLNVNLRRPGRNSNPILEVPEVPEDVMVANVKEWKVACPQLTSVTFTDGLRVCSQHHDSA